MAVDGVELVKILGWIAFSIIQPSGISTRTRVNEFTNLTANLSLQCHFA